MAGSDTSLAATALAISLVAFLTALGQLLQQFFATADGYRRCQRSVMRDWASKTRLRWRWREFRFETLYTTPHISMSSKPRRTTDKLITGSRDSRVATFMLTPLSTQHSNNELASWVLLLDQIHLSEYEPDYKRIHVPSEWEQFSVAAVDFQERSWDFILPEIVRPMATSTISDIAIIARRLGMRWKDFRPYDGYLRAEGGSYIITSSAVRTLGPVLQFSLTKRPRVPRPSPPSFTAIRPDRDPSKEYYIRDTSADLLGFGIVESFFFGEKIDLGTQKAVLSTLAILDESGTCASIVRQRMRDSPDYHLRAGDIVAMAMTMAQTLGSYRFHVAAPSENMLGFSRSGAGRRAFRISLEQCLSTERYLSGVWAIKVLSRCQKLQSSWDIWEAALPNTDLHCHEECLTFIHETFGEVMAWVYKHEKPVIASYEQVLGAHLRQAVFQENGETSLANVNHPDYESEVKAYFDVWPSMLKDLNYIENHECQKAFDMWITILFRACLWGACHVFLPGERVPSEYFQSQIPVYIG